MLFRKRIYLDNTATTRTRREVINEMTKYFNKVFANPSSIHQAGLIARGSIEMARERIANVLNCTSEEIIFTGSGSEANNTAIKGVAHKLKNIGRHIITSPIEHSSIIRTCESLKEEGFEITYIDVDSSGNFNLKHLAESIRKDTILVTLGYINNEIGTIQDINAISEIVKSKNIILHFDAVQALPYLHIDCTKINADLISFSGHKLYAPKGIGILYIKNETNLLPLIHGGEQEFGLRSGTENIPYIVGLSKAIQLNEKEKDEYVKTLTGFRNQILDSVTSNIPDVIITGDQNNRAPNNASFCIKNINGKMLVKKLSQLRIDVSSGAACSSSKNKPSHVLSACRINEDYLYGGLRVTVGKYNTQKEINYFLKTLPKVVKEMRENNSSYRNEAVFISQKEFRQKLLNKEEVQIVDVRPVKYPNKEIPGSIHSPLWKLKQTAQKLNREDEVIVVCYQGDIISPQAHQQLVKLGFNKAKVLKGGLFGYFNFIR
jgi:cysteine desulfurase